MMSDSGYLKFTGKYAELKKMGYSFQKLYAKNYMQWNKNGVRVWKNGAEITLENINAYKLIKFFRTNPKVRTWNNGKSIGFFKFYDQDHENYEYLPATDENKKKYSENQAAWGLVQDDCEKENLPPYYSTELVGLELIEQLQEFKDLGWYELVTVPEDD